ncbi:MAG: class I SAM-dependent methyltransferase [Selenomonadaceae bacterium]|nr:class I SAM-dependent methyltransferase [Selenomonadaceae bacterium]
MRYLVIARSTWGKMLLDLLRYTKIQAGAELTAYFELIENSVVTSYKFHHNVNQIHSELNLEKVSSVQINKVDFDGIYIVGSDFDLRQQFLEAGVDYKKIFMCYGDINICRCPLDDIFVIPKAEPQVPFKKAPAEIYQQYAGETAKAHNRRLREGFFEKYCKGEGLDICYGADLIIPGCSGWDFRNGDAQYLAGVEDESFDFVYSSHGLEHMYDVRTALKNWFRVVKKGGYFLLAIPHRDLYEKKNSLPSRWNGDHKHMFLIGKAEPPDTLDIVEEIKCSLENYDIKYIKTCDEGHTIDNPLVHSDGEYQIEIVIQKIG